MRDVGQVLVIRMPTENPTEICELLLGETDRLLSRVGTPNNNSDVRVFVDFDDTLFYRDGFGLLLEQGKIEEAFALPYTPMPHTKQFLEYLKNRKIGAIIVTKRESGNDIKKLLEQYKLDGLVEDVLCQKNVAMGDGNIATISKGQTICEFLRKLKEKPRGILFIDDIVENINSVVQWVSKEYRDIRLQTILIPAF